MSVNPGFFAIPIHDHGGFADLVGKAQPSAIAGHVSAWSPTEVVEWRKRSPNTFVLLILGEVADDQFDWRDPTGQAKRHMDKIQAMVDYQDGQGNRYPKDDNSAWMLLNEPNVWFDEKDNSGVVVCTGDEKRKRFATYCVTALGIAHSRGLHLAVFNFSVGWPFVRWIDSLDYWTQFGAVVSAMRKGDIVNLHEYWDRQGPAAHWPYMPGRHLQCPYQTLGDGTPVRILIGECGLDEATTGGFPNRGYRLFMSVDQYYEQLRVYHGCLADKRVFGTAIFMWDNADETRWWSFDLRGEFSGKYKREDFLSLPNAMAMPAKIAYPLSSARVSQKFGENPTWYTPLPGHNGVDFSCVVGTPILACLRGKIVNVGNEGSSGYGLYMDVNYGAFILRYGHLSSIVKEAQSWVNAGDTIALSGNTGRSTGPHLHLGMRIWGQFNESYNGWADPLPYMSTVATPAPTPPATTSDVVVARWHAEEATRTLEQAEAAIADATVALTKANQLREDAEQRLKVWVVPAMRKVEGV